MSDSLETTYRPLLEAFSFAARSHQAQLRKDEKTPYVSHVYRVCFIVRHVFGIDDNQTLMAAALHDTVEDTTTDFDDLEEKFGREVATCVAALSKDKRLQEEEREKAYEAQLAKGHWQVKICKLADIFDNLMDSVTSRPEQRQRVLRNSHRYLKALQHDLPEPARRSWEIVSRLLAEMESKK